MDCFFRTFFQLKIGFIARSNSLRSATILEILYLLNCVQSCFSALPLCGSAFKRQRFRLSHWCLQILLFKIGAHRRYVYDTAVRSGKGCFGSSTCCSLDAPRSIETCLYRPPSSIKDRSPQMMVSAEKFVVCSIAQQRIGPSAGPDSDC